MPLIVVAAVASLLTSPCEAVTKGDAEKILHGVVVDVPAEQMGEETAPSCLFATKGRVREIKISIWSQDELPVVGMKDAASYFAKLKAEDGGARDLDGFGERAFETWRLRAGGLSEGSVVVLKGERLFVFDFLGVSLVADGHAFVARAMAHL